MNRRIPIGIQVPGGITHRHTGFIRFFLIHPTVAIVVIPIARFGSIRVDVTASDTVIAVRALITHSGVFVSKTIPVIVQIPQGFRIDVWVAVVTIIRVVCISRHISTGGHGLSAIAIAIVI